MAKRQSETVYEFRPFPDVFDGPVRRYANGEWLPDDGQHDLAFIGKGYGGFPYCFYVSIRHYQNIICSWADDHWPVIGHPDKNPWHYALEAGAKDWGEYCSPYYKHQNELAGSSGMRKMSSECGCSNGRGVNFDFNDKHILAGLVRDRDTRQVFEWPEGMRCMYCNRLPKSREKASDVRQQYIIKHRAVARHTALKRLGIKHEGSPFTGLYVRGNECDCLVVVKNEFKQEAV